MKNLVKKHNFGNTKSQQNAALRNLAVNLITNEHVTTTKAKAKSVQSFVEKIFARYSDDIHRKRLLEAKLGTKSLTEKVDELSKDRFKDLDSGFVQIYRVGHRKGDGAEMFKVILNGYEPHIKSKLKKVKNEKANEEE